MLQDLSLTCADLLESQYKGNRLFSLKVKLQAAEATREKLNPVGSISKCITNCIVQVFTG